MLYWILFYLNIHRYEVSIDLIYDLTIVEMAKAYNLNLYEYLKYLLEHRPNKDMKDNELAKLAPWNAEVQEKCSNKTE